MDNNNNSNTGVGNVGGDVNQESSNPLNDTQNISAPNEINKISNTDNIPFQNTNEWNVHQKENTAVNKQIDNNGIGQNISNDSNELPNKTQTWGTQSQGSPTNVNNNANLDWRTQPSTPFQNTPNNTIASDNNTQTQSVPPTSNPNTWQDIQHNSSNNSIGINNRDSAFSPLGNTENATTENKNYTDNNLQQNNSNMNTQGANYSPWQNAQNTPPDYNSRATINDVQTPVTHQSGYTSSNRDALSTPSQNGVNYTTKVNENSLNTVWKNPMVHEESDNNNNIPPTSSTNSYQTNQSSFQNNEKFTWVRAIKFGLKGIFSNFLMILALVVFYVLAVGLSYIIIQVILNALIPTHAVLPQGALLCKINCATATVPATTNYSVAYTVKTIISIVLILFIDSILTIGWFRVSADIYNGGKPTFKSFLGGKGAVLRFIGGEIITTIVLTIIYFIALIVLAIIAATIFLFHNSLFTILMIILAIGLTLLFIYILCAYCLWPLPLIVNNYPIVRSIKESFRVTKGRISGIFWLFFFFMLIVGVVGFLEALFAIITQNLVIPIILMVITFIIEIPLLYLVLTYSYLTLEKNKAS